MQIGLLKDALRKAGLPLYLAPYGVLPTAYECGIIEVRPSSRCLQRTALEACDDFEALSNVSLHPAEQECTVRHVCAFSRHEQTSSSRSRRAQVVPNCNSRAGLGETADGSLYEIFRREFGAPGTARFEAARHNFVVSEAG